MVLLVRTERFVLSYGGICFTVFLSDGLSFSNPIMVYDLG